jgi:hypothetical protein
MPNRSYRKYRFWGVKIGGKGSLNPFRVPAATRFLAAPVHTFDLLEAYSGNLVVMETAIGERGVTGGTRR